jgi:hypothetical protein
VGVFVVVLGGTRLGAGRDKGANRGGLRGVRGGDVGEGGGGGGRVVKTRIWGSDFAKCLRTTLADVHKMFANFEKC